MATVVEKTVKGYDYVYRVEYLGHGNQKWEILGRADSLNIDTGPTEDSAAELLDQDTMTGLDPSETIDVLDEGFRLSDGDVDRDVELNRWSPNPSTSNDDRLYINNWVDSGDVYVDLRSGEVHGLDEYTVTNDDGAVTITTGGGDTVTIETGADREWETVDGLSVNQGDTVRFQADEGTDRVAKAPSDMGVSNYPVEAVRNRAPVEVTGIVEQSMNEDGWGPAVVEFETDMGEEVRVSADEVTDELFERVVGE